MNKLKIKIVLVTLSIFSVYFITTSFVKDSISNTSSSSKVAKYLHTLGDKVPLHYLREDKIDPAKVKIGENLVKYGYTDPTETNLGKRLSKHFVCIDCHNVVKEDPNLAINDPEARLDFAIKNNLNFLPGTTLYGTVNKTSWYNQDYEKKYGDLVAPARDTLENAIQLCAVVCSQGRALENDEMEAMIHYLNSIGYAMDDLNLTDKEHKKIIETTNGNKQEGIDLLKSKYMEYSPATFMNPMEIGKRGLGKSGNVKNGQKIYELSCLTCHKENGVTNYKLDLEQLTFKQLKLHSKRHKTYSVYDLTRKGTYTKNGYKPYMPNYTQERLSNQQLEDLMAYINKMAKDGTVKKKYTSMGNPSF